jgi:hypothetical protein
MLYSEFWVYYGGFDGFHMKAFTGVGLQENELLLPPPADAFFYELLSPQLW